MAADYVPFFFVFTVLFIKKTETLNLTEDIDNNVTSHLKLEIVQKYCLHRDDACKSDNIKVCAVRMKDKKKQHKDFQNSCYLFLSNMCDYPGEEYYTVASGTCEEHLTRRRSNEVEVGSETNLTETTAVDNETVTDAGNVTHTALREDNDTESSDDSKEWSFDNHVCPYDCPQTYVPECLLVNRAAGGKYYRMFYFVNHCMADDYYCKHNKDFPAPPSGEDEDEDVMSSPISWSRCASSRFMQFSRFAEAASSMAHYGWLGGPYKATHIMEPHEQIPGFG